MCDFAQHIACPAAMQRLTNLFLAGMGSAVGSLAFQQGQSLEEVEVLVPSMVQGWYDSFGDTMRRQIVAILTNKAPVGIDFALPDGSGAKLSAAAEAFLRDQDES